MNLDLYLSNQIIKDAFHKNTSGRGIKITWSETMLHTLINKFPTTYNKDIAKELNIGWRSVIRKARELKLEKEPGFLELRRSEITKMAVKSHPPHQHKGDKGWSVPNSESSRFKLGNISVMNDPEIIKKVHKKRNETIRKEKLRLKYGLPQLTKMKLL